MKSFKDQLNAWVKEGICGDVTAIHFPNGQYEKFCNQLLNKVRYEPCTDGCALLVKGNMTNEDIKAVVIDSYSPLRGNVPTRWGSFYIKEA